MWSEEGSGPIGANTLAPLMDGLDVGLILLGAQAEVVHANPVAREVLGGPGCPIQILGERLCTLDEAEQAMLHQALEDCRINPQSHAWPTPVAEGHAMAAAPGVLLFLGSGPQRISLAITPLGDWQLSMVTLGRSRATAARLAHNFARAYGLTPTETRVLAALCAGGSPESIASLHGVEVSTVRTQLARLRNRTRSSSMREVLQQVFSLPPVMARLEGPPQSENEANGGF